MSIYPIVTEQDLINSGNLAEQQKILKNFWKLKVEF